MRTIRAIIIVMLLGLLASCDNSDSISPVDTTIDPFSNGGNQKNMIVVISDIHLGADLAYSEINKNLKPLEKLLEKIRVSPNVKELVIAGDFLDEWFVPATVNTYAGKDQKDFVQRIAIANKGVIDAFNRIIQAGEITVTYIPGNHDLTITAQNIELILPGIKQARDVEQGLGTYSPIGYPEIAIEHGHRYNFFCAPDSLSNKDIAPGSITPPGYFFTRIAVQHVVQNCYTAGDTLPVVTQNISGGESQNLAFIYWNIWKNLILKYPVENKFEEKIIVTNIDGFTETYAINDLVPFQLSAGGFIDVNLFKGIQDTWNKRQLINKVAVNIPVTQAISNAGSASESDNQAKIQYFLNPASNKRVVVFGHTHEPKIISSENYLGKKSVYANTGTWIDHNPNKKMMSFVVITPQNANLYSQTYIKLYNFENEIATKMANDSLRF